MRTEAEEFEKKIAALKDTSAAQAKKLEGVRKELDEQGKAYQEKEAELITSLQEDVRFSCWKCSLVSLFILFDCWPNHAAYATGLLCWENNTHRRS